MQYVIVSVPISVRQLPWLRGFRDDNIYYSDSVYLTECNNLL